MREVLFVWFGLVGVQQLRDLVEIRIEPWVVERVRRRKELGIDHDLDHRGTYR